MKKRIGRYLFYANRGRQYLGLFTATFVFILWLDNRNIDIAWWMYPLLILFAAFCLVLTGFIDVKIFRFRESEIEAAERNNPVIMEIFKDIKQLKKK